MKWKLCSRVAVALCGAALCASAYGEVVLDECAGYPKGPTGHYDVVWDGYEPHIEILKPSNALFGPYDFECYDNAAGQNPERTIGGITIDGSLIGDVKIMVRGHSTRDYGASNVEILNLVQDDVTSTVEQFEISGDLGDGGDTYVGNIDGPFEVASIVSYMHAKYILSDMSIGTVVQGASLEADNLHASLYVTGAGPHEGNIGVGDFHHPDVIDITGTMAGSIAAGSL